MRRTVGRTTYSLLFLLFVISLLLYMELQEVVFADVERPQQKKCKLAVKKAATKTKPHKWTDEEVEVY